MDDEKHVSPMSMVDAFELQQILNTMDVPEKRRTDTEWLHRNLGVRNSNHELFLTAMILIDRLRR